MGFQQLQCSMIPMEIAECLQYAGIRAAIC